MRFCQAKITILVHTLKGDQNRNTALYDFCIALNEGLFGIQRDLLR